MNIEQLDEAFTGQPITAADVFAALIVLIVGHRDARGWSGDCCAATSAGPAARPTRWRSWRADRGSGSICRRLGLAWALEHSSVSEWGDSRSSSWSRCIIVALAIKPIAESFAISVVITSRPAFGVGDEIGVSGIVGEVLEITERSVVVRLRDGARVHIPNAEVISERVTVLSTDAERRSTVDVRLVYDTDIDVAEQVIRAALADVDGVLRIGSIRAVSINGCVQLSIRFWHESSISAAIGASDAVVRAVHRALQQAGIHGAPFFEIALAEPRTPRRHHFGAT